MSLGTKEALVPQIRRLQKSFSKTSHIDTRERERPVQSSTARGGGEKGGRDRDRDSATAFEALELELIQIDRADYGDDDDIFMADLYCAEGSQEAEGRQKVVHLLTQINTKEGEFKSVSSPVPVKADQQEHAFKIPLDRTLTPAAHTSGSAPNTAESRSRKYADGAAVDNDDDFINVTRIIIGNLDTFMDRYPYFIDKVNGWTKVMSLSALRKTLSQLYLRLTVLMFVLSSIYLGLWTQSRVRRTYSRARSADQENDHPAPYFEAFVHSSSGVQAGEDTRHAHCHRQQKQQCRQDERSGHSEREQRAVQRSERAALGGSICSEEETV